MPQFSWKQFVSRHVQGGFRRGSRSRRRDSRAQIEILEGRILLSAAPIANASNAVQFISDGFESGAPSTTWGEVYSGRPGATPTLDVAQGVSHTGDFSGRIHYSQDEDNAMLLSYNNNFNDGFYVEFYSMYPQGLTTLPDGAGLKQLRLFLNPEIPGKDPYQFEIHTSPEGPKFQAFVVGSNDQEQVVEVPFPIVAGEWFKLGVYLKYNTVGEQNGIMQLWRDNSLLSTRSDMDFRSTAANGANSLMVGGNVSTNGRAFGAFDRYLDDILVTDSPVGHVDQQMPVTIQGTPGNDFITLAVSSVLDTVTINGVQSTIDVSTLSGLTLDSGGGTDTITILGSNPGITTTVSSTGTATVNLGNAGTVQGIAGTVIVLNSTPGSTALNVDNSADTVGRTVTFDTTTNPPGNGAQLGTIMGLAPGVIQYGYAGTGVTSVKLGAGPNAEIIRAPVTGGTVLNITGGGPNDVASLVGAGNDVFVGQANAGTLSNSSGFRATITGVGIVAGYAAPGGTDQGNLDLQAAPKSTLVGAPDKTYAQGVGFAAFGFGPVYAYGKTIDVAQLYPARNGTAVGTPASEYIAGPGYLVQAFGFGNAYAYGDSTNFAKFFPGSGDRMIGTATYGLVTGPGYVDAAVGFGNVTAIGDASNSAELFPAPHDNFIATPAFGYVNGNGYADVALGFGTIQARGDATNTASLFLDSDYRFVSKQGQLAYMHNSQQTQLDVAIGFGTVNTFAKDNSNEAFLYDSPGNDTFYGRGVYGGLVGSGFIVATSRFGTVNALSLNGGNDHLDIAGLNYVFRQAGNWI